MYNRSGSESESLVGKGKAPADEAVRRYGAVSPSTDAEAEARATRKKLLWAGVKMAILFVVCTIALWGTLKVALPTLEE